MDRKASLSRGDLLRCLDVKEGVDAAFMVKAELCGFEAVAAPEEKAEILVAPPEVRGKARPSSEEVLEEEPSVPSSTRVKQRFWLAASMDVESREAVDERRQMPAHYRHLDDLLPEELQWRGEPRAGKPLLPWSKLWPFLYRVLGKRRPSRQPDVRRITEALIRGRPLRQLPRKTRNGWHPRVRLWLDRRVCMAALWDDYADLIRRLEQARGSAGLEVSVVELGAEGCFVERRFQLGQGMGQTHRLRMPDEGETVLLLGDLGQLSPGGKLSARAWQTLGTRLGSSDGQRPWALVPCPPERWSPQLAKVWRFAYWDRGRRLPVGNAGQAARPLAPEDLAQRRSEQRHLLRDLVSPAIRVERGLLRDLRTLCPTSTLNVGAEVDLWESAWARGAVQGFSLLPEASLEGRRRLVHLEKERLAEVVKRLRHHHAYTEKVFSAVEILGLRDFLTESQWQELIDDGVLSDEVLSDAMAFYGRLVVTLYRRSEGGDQAWLRDLARWVDRDLDRLEHRHLESKELQALWALNRQVLQDRAADQALPAFVEKENVEWIRPPEANEQTIMLGWRYGGLSASRAGEEGLQMPLASLQTRATSLWAEAMTEDGEMGDRRELEFQRDHRLQWKAEEDDFKQISVASDRETLYIQAIQRPEWAKRMGYDRHGLYADLEVLGVGFRMRWIPPGRFLMGDEEENSPQHEVTLTEGFWMAETLTTEALYGVAVGSSVEEESQLLPKTGLEWSWCLHLCAFLESYCPELSFGPPTEAQWEYACRAGTTSNYNDGSDSDSALLDLAWHSENSAYGIKPVRQKRPNAWGLYDMHGNAWEWCLDARRSYREEGEEDPIGLVGSDSNVVRGGSWLDAAHDCRSSFRAKGVLSESDDGIGFRFVAGRKREDKGGMIGLWSKEAQLPSASVPKKGLPKPSWATRVSKDSYGLLAEVEIEGVVFAFRRIEPGSFLMGSTESEKGRYGDEGPQHEVTLTKRFWMAATPTTQEQWQAVMGNDQNPSHFSGQAKHPVEKVSWEDCQQYIERLNARLPGLQASFPTEAQWEYACRAGTTSAFNQGKDCTEPSGVDPALGDVGWYDENSESKTHPVGEKSANAWGLYDMHGNVDEWCLDGMRPYTDQAVVDPLGPLDKDAGRVLRGGGWFLNAGYCRSANRDAYEPGNRSRNLGFRLVAGQEPDPGIGGARGGAAVAEQASGTPSTAARA